MSPEIDKLFQKIYRQFKRTKGKCDSIAVLQTILLKQIGGAKFSVSPVSIQNSMAELQGFCISYMEHRVFIPETSLSFRQNTLIARMGDTLNEAEIIIPNYISFGVLGRCVKEIKDEKNQNTKIEVGDQVLTSIFTPAMLSLLVTEHYTQFPALEKCLVQIRETTETYCLGFYRSAITTLLPCIESTIRMLGVRLGINQPDNVGTQFLLGIYDAWLKFYINDYVYQGFDWVPVEVRSSKFFSTFEERYQIGLNGRNYIEKHLYQNTQSDKGLSKLNRHGILHGFMTEYYTKGNYLRLINLLNNLCFMLTISGDPVSLYLPQETIKSQTFHFNLVRLERAGLMRAAHLDEMTLPR